MTATATLKQCKIADCEKPPKAHGLCVKHYSRLRRHGHAEPTRRYSGPQVGICPVEGCEQPKSFNGMCKLHATRVARHGDPLIVIHQRDRDLPRGADNPHWAGDRITYGGMHIRVRKTRGPASEHSCVDCARTASQWSYDRSDPNERMASEGPYSTNVDHYVARCVPCHKKHDLRALGKSANGYLPEGSAA